MQQLTVAALTEAGRQVWGLGRIKVRARQGSRQVGRERESLGITAASHVSELPIASRLASLFFKVSND